MGTEVQCFRQSVPPDNQLTCLHHVYISRVAYRIFFMGGTHISAASRGSSGMLPQKIFVFYVGL